MFHAKNILIHKQVLHFLNTSLMLLTMTPWSNMFCLTKKEKSWMCYIYVKLTERIHVSFFHLWSPTTHTHTHTPSCELFHYNAMSDYIIYKYKCNSFQESQFQFLKSYTMETKNTIPKMWTVFHIILYSRFNKHGANKPSGLNSFLNIK